MRKVFSSRWIRKPGNGQTATIDVAALTESALVEIPKFAPLCRERWRTSESIH
jgi:hypothetical protein